MTLKGKLERKNNLHENYEIEAKYYLEENNWNYSDALTEYKIDLSEEANNIKKAELAKKMSKTNDISKIKKIMRKISIIKPKTK